MDLKKKTKPTKQNSPDASFLSFAKEEHKKETFLLICETWYKAYCVMLQNHPFSCCLEAIQSQAEGWTETYVSQLSYFPKSFGVIVCTGLQ